MVRAGAGSGEASAQRAADGARGTLPDGLIAWRRAAGLTQKELARQARVSRSSISHIENGRYEPSCGFAGKVCRALSLALAAPLYTWNVFPASFERPAALPAAQQQATKEVAGDGVRS